MAKCAYLSGVFINPELLGKAGRDNGGLRRSTSLIYNKFFDVAKELDLDFIYAGVVEHNVPALGLAGHEEGFTVAAIPDHVSELTNRGEVPEGEEKSLAQLPMVLILSPEKLPGLSEIPGVRILDAGKQDVVRLLKEWKNEAAARNPSKQIGVPESASVQSWVDKSQARSGPDNRPVL